MISSRTNFIQRLLPSWRFGFEVSAIWEISFGDIVKIEVRVIKIGKFSSRLSLPGLQKAIAAEEGGILEEAVFSLKL